MKKFKKYLIALLGLFVLSGCSLPGLASNQDEDTIAITGGITSEGQILGNMVAGMIEHYTDKKTTIINNLGTTTITHQAMLNGDADISSTRYTGTDIASTLLLDPVMDPDESLKVAQTEFKKRYDEVWFPPYGLDNTYTFLVRKDTAEKYDLKTISDLADVQSELKVGADRAWMTRAGDGYDGLQETYGFSFDNILPMQIGLVYDAVAAHQMDVVLGYSTDGRIQSYDLVMLEDDKQFFPPYDASMIVNQSLLDENPELEGILAKLEGKVDTETMQKLNFEADNDLIEPSIVAQEFLEEHNYFEEDNK